MTGIRHAIALSCPGPDRRIPDIGSQTARRSDGLQSDGLRARGNPCWCTVGAQSGQGTVEYVGLILLVSLLMVGMVAAMKGFSGKQGTELAELIVDKIQSAVDKVAFR